MVIVAIDTISVAKPPLGLLISIKAQRREWSASAGLGSSFL